MYCTTKLLSFNFLVLDKMVIQSGSYFIKERKIIVSYNNVHELYLVSPVQLREGKGIRMCYI